jgi:hypothetical protein
MGALGASCVTALALALLGGCAHAPAPEHATGIARYGRPRGMPIGTGIGSGMAQLDDSDGTPPPELTGSTAPPIPKYDLAAPAPPPCAGCVELSLVLNDINQRDEFAFDARGASVTRVIWTLLVNLNSDQLAVQPFVDDHKGKYTEIDANAFPLGKPVELVHEFQGTAQRIGLIVASSGAWTGDQRVSVFVDAVRAEGPRGFERSFDSGAEGFTPRTQAHQPRVDFHAAPPAAN